MSTLEAHPAAELFPLLDGEKYEKLKASIAEHGLINPIVLYGGQILDGRNRYRACLDTDTELRFEEYTGDSPTAYAWAQNGERRHLTSSQLMAVSVKMLPALEEEAKKRAGGRPRKDGEKPSADLQQVSTGRAAEQAAALTGVGARSVYKAKEVKEKDPELFKRIEAGEVTVNAASEILAGRKAASLDGVPRVDAPEPAPQPQREKAQSRGVGLTYAHQAIAALGRIPVDDGLRDEALDEVIRWIEFNR